jgi:hypothetical protein
MAPCSVVFEHIGVWLKYTMQLWAVHNVCRNGFGVAIATEIDRSFRLGAAGQALGLLGVFW